jgi:outer membrane biosynthesis protein TonB
MKYVLTLITGLTISFAQAQAIDSTIHSEDSNTIICVFEQGPEFTGGQDALLKYLSQHIRLPEEVISGQVKGKVYVQFSITEKGQVKDAVIVKGLNKKPCV